MKILIRQAFTKTQINYILNNFRKEESLKIGIKTAFGVMLINSEQGLDIIKKSGVNDLYISLANIEHKESSFDCLLLERPIVPDIEPELEDFQEPEYSRSYSDIARDGMFY